MRVRFHIKAFVVVAVLAVGGLFANSFVGVGDVRTEVHTIGHVAGSEVQATSDLYFALNDMDAQLANVLMLGDATGLGLTRAAALGVYEQRRTQANGDLQQATAMAGDDQQVQRAITTLLDGRGRYEALAAQAVLLDGQIKHPVGKPAPAALTTYRQATDLMRQEVLPAAQRIAALNAAGLDRTYAASDTGNVLLCNILAGLAALAALIGLQVYLTRRFRRLINPALVAATLVTAGLIAASLVLFSSEGEHLRVAKKDAFDSVLALAQARAVSYDANADESRYLLDPDRAAGYERSFGDKSRQVDDHLAAEQRNLTFGGERDAAALAVARWHTYQADDKHVRELATSGRLAEAVAYCTSVRPGDSNYDFNAYDEALVAVTAINEKAFATAVTAGDSELDGWNLGLPIATVAILALLVVGVWPRLAEYR